MSARPDPAPASPDHQARCAAAAAAIQRIAGRLDVGQLTIAQYRARVRPGEPSAITVVRLFGGWNAATAAAGLTVNAARKYGSHDITDRQVSAALAAAAAAFGNGTGKAPHKLTQEFYAAWRRDAVGPTLGVTAIRNRYGPWRQAVSAALAQNLHSV